MRRSFRRLAVGSGLESGVDGGIEQDAAVMERGIHRDIARPIDPYVVHGIDYILGRLTHCLYGGAGHQTEAVLHIREEDIENAMPGALLPGLGKDCARHALKHGVAHLRVLSNANGGVETDAVEDFDGGFAGLDRAESVGVETRLQVATLALGWGTADHMTIVDLAEQNGDLVPTVRQWAIVAHFADRVDLTGLGVDASRASGSDGIDAVLIRNADEFVANFPVEIAHSVTIEGTVPDAWGNGAGLRLGAEGDAGEWEFAGLLMKAPRE